ncbi:Por secretion system C-terminal sorting domain-containing protein [Hymenobacter daecheongensis DSM 21074]|uniref:Por secretion system C-terminal sorting domain-containing protein n=1 Tax=Hymenobacter daecheongensis DSM 21074 TaxID=1121955 RepID=A0A1M6B2D2_9BACT|nr:T9SS type A sorting domain-containing protein [Hymenobacter daecheongensis]SHI42827.1 Por secretion system C-terminal sorting domain-containing protein [Hymenobacter daecheongensis DSM 21074]
MKTATLTLILLGAALLAGSAQAQTKSAKPATAKPAAKEPVKAAATTAAKPPVAVAAAEAKPAPVELITSKMEQAPPSTDAIKVRAEANPLTHRLTVRTDVAGPTRVEVNDAEGRPVITRDLIAGDEATVLDVSSLPPGYYIVHCTAGSRSGMRRVLVGQ